MSSLPTRFDHLQINVANPEFYQALFAALGARAVSESSQASGYKIGDVTIWVIWAERKYQEHLFHRKAIGLNHLSFELPSRRAVDKFTRDFVIPRQAVLLYESPRLFPEYGVSHYAAYFEDPSRVKLEVFAKK